MAKYYYFPKIPLMICTPALHYLEEKGWLEKKISSKPKVLESLRTEGQKDPLIVTCNMAGTKWIVEPGQYRWYALYYLKVEYVSVVVKVNDNDIEKDAFNNILKKYKYLKINNHHEMISVFKATDIYDHGGLGYLARRGWLIDLGWKKDQEEYKKLKKERELQKMRQKRGY